MYCEAEQKPSRQNLPEPLRFVFARVENPVVSVNSRCSQQIEEALDRLPRRLFWFTSHHIAVIHRACPACRGVAVLEPRFDAGPGGPLF